MFYCMFYFTCDRSLRSAAASTEQYGAAQISLSLTCAHHVFTRLINELVYDYELAYRGTCSRESKRKFIGTAAARVSDETAALLPLTERTTLQRW